MNGIFMKSYKEYVEKIQDKKLVLFCAGKRCVEIIQQYYHYPYDEIAFICDNDKNKWGDKIFTIPICSPQKLAENPEDYVVLITVYDNFILKRIMQQLKEMHVQDIYSSAILMFANEIERYDSNGKRKYHEFNTYKKIEKNMDKIDMVRSMLEDEKSKVIYNQWVEKVKYNIRDYKEVADDLYEHYFEDEIFKYSQEEFLVDGGAFDGDDTIWMSTMLQQQGKKLKKAYCFEPDNGNWGKTYRNLEKYYGKKPKIDAGQIIAETEEYKVFKAGLFDSNCGVGFCEYGAHSSRVTVDDTGISIPAVKLDDVIGNEPVSFIKYDLEGADIPALRGAEATIVNNKPKLALSIYHNIEDLWEIPLLVKQMVPEYKLFVRHHTIYLWDKILYAAVDKDLL